MLGKGKGAKDRKLTRKARIEERRQFLMPKSLTCLVIHNSENQDSKGRSNLRKIWVVTKYICSEFTQREEDSQKISSSLLKNGASICHFC